MPQCIACSCSPHNVLHSPSIVCYHLICILCSVLASYCIGGLNVLLLLLLFPPSLSLSPKPLLPSISLFPLSSTWSSLSYSSLLHLVIPLLLLSPTPLIPPPLLTRNYTYPSLLHFFLHLLQKPDQCRAADSEGRGILFGGMSGGCGTSAALWRECPTCYHGDE